MRLILGRCNRVFTIALAMLPLAASLVLAQDAAQRPRITGISHAGYFVSDLNTTLTFWHDFLGFDESYSLKRPGSDIGTGAVSPPLTPTCTIAFGDPWVK